MPMMLDSNDEAEAIAAPRAAHWGFWGTLVWGAVIAIIFVALQIVTFAGVVLSRHDDLGRLSRSELEQVFSSTANDGVAISLMAFITTVVCGGLVVGVIKLKKGSILREYLCIKPVSLATIGRWLGLLLGLVAVLDTTTVVLGRSVVSEFGSMSYATASPVWMLWAAFVIAGPLFEELFFRGFLLRGFEASFMGPIGAVVVTAVLWTANHLQYDAYELATVLCLGLLFGTARLVTGSLVVPMALHAAANLVATAEAAILR